MNKLFLLLFLVFLFHASNQSLYAQAGPPKQWDKTIGGSRGDVLSSQQQTSDGGYILGGSSESGISGDKSQPTKGGFFLDYWVVKLDANGNKVWDKTIGGSDSEVLYSLQQTADGGYILGGKSVSGNSGDKSQPCQGMDDYWVVKLDANGSKIWDRTFGGSSSDILYKLQQTSDGGYILGGTSESGISGNKSQASRGGEDYWVIKLDANGNKTWDKSFGGADKDLFASLQQTSDGGYIVGGTSLSGNTGDKTQPSKGLQDYWILKLDANGNKVWDKVYGGNDAEGLGSLQQTSDGGYILGGHSYSGISIDKSQACLGGEDFWVVKLDVNGNKVWDKTFGGNNFDLLYSLWQTFDGGYILGGFSDSDIGFDKSQVHQGVFDYWVVKLDSNGNKNWERTFGGSNKDNLFSLQQTSDGGFILGGESWSNASIDKTQASKGSVDYWVIKLGPDCSALKAVLSATCLAGGSTVQVSGIQSGSTSAKSWTLSYSVNGVSQTVTGTTPTFTLAQNAAPGTIYTLVSITAGSCTASLNQSITIQPIPLAPTVSPGKNCGVDSVTLVASGAPIGGKYVWYVAASGGTAIKTNASGNFSIPLLTVDTVLYVAATNINGCEGPRTKVKINKSFCTEPFFPNPGPFIPNIITQNHDTQNDTFKPQNLPEGKWQLQVYNRWGVNIYEAIDYRNNWPEKEIANGTYYYLLSNPETGKHYKGWLEVTE